MQEEFEKKVQERMHTFGMQPSHHVWDDIDAVLSRKKRRPVFFGWWVLLGLMAIGGGVFLFEQSSRQVHVAVRPQAKVIDSTNNAASKPVAAMLGKDETAKQETANSTTNEKPGKEQSPASINKQENITAPKKNKITIGVLTAVKPAMGKTSIAIAIPPAQQNDKTGAQVVPVTNEPIAIIPATGQNKGNEKPAVSAAPATEAPLQAAVNEKKPADNKDPLATEQAVAKATELPAAPQPKEKDEKKKQGNNTHTAHQWLVTVSSGITQTISYGQFNQPFYSLAGPLGYTAQNVPALTAPDALKYDIFRPGTGYNVAAGGLYQLTLNKHWRLSSGVKVAYLSNTQKTGAFYNSGLYISYNNNNIYSGSERISSFYQSAPAAANTVVNKMWRVQLPVDVNFTVNPKSKTKLLLNAGFSVERSFSTKWLIPDTRYGKLYYNKEVLNNTIFSWQAGPAVELQNKMQLGLYYQQSFTTMAKDYVVPKLYWQNVNMYIAIPIGKKK